MKNTAGLISVIDIGSNSFQQIIAKVGKNNRISYIDRQKQTLRLLDFSAETKKIPEHTIQNALDILRQFKANADFYQARIIATASSATREADNGSELLQRIKKECHFSVELISGHREATIVYNAVKLHLKKEHIHTCVMDIGGGSFELVYGSGNEIVYRNSLPLGVVRLSQMFLKQYRTNIKAINEMRHYITDMLCETFEPLTLPKRTLYIGTSGAFRVVSNILNNNIKNTSRFNTADMNELARKVLHYHTTQERESFLPGEPERADILPASIVMLQEITRYFNIKKISYVPFGLREGLLYEAAGLIKK